MTANYPAKGMRKASQISFQILYLSFKDVMYELIHIFFLVVKMWLVKSPASGLNRNRVLVFFCRF